jgi:hypothetical protein
MSKLYGEADRPLQDELDSWRLADLMEGGGVHGAFATHESLRLSGRIIGKRTRCPTLRKRAAGAPDLVSAGAPL